MIKKLRLLEKKIDKINYLIFTPKKGYKQEIIYFHGGGLFFKAAPYHYRNIFLYCKQTESKVFLIDYPLLDKMHGRELLLTTFKSLDKINLSNPIILADSAGAILAVLYYLLNPQEYKALMLIYPVLDKRCVSESMKKYISTPMWNAKLNKLMWKKFLQDEDFISSNENETILIENLYLETAEIDCLHDEGIDFYNKAVKNGSQGLLLETKGTLHGFDYRKDKTTNFALNKRIAYINSLK